MDKPIVFVAGGTRGDIQPYVALARYMHQRGYRVLVATSPRWNAWVASYDVPWVSLPPDPTELLLDPQYAAALTWSHGIVRGAIATQKYWRDMQPLLRPLVTQGAEIIKQAAVVVAGVASQWAATLAERYAVPVVWGLLQPVAPTSSFASPLWPSRTPPHDAERSHQRMAAVMWRQWRAVVDQPVGGLMNVNRQPALFGFSPHLVAPWHGMALTHTITGAWEMPEREALPAPVRRFVAVGIPYVVATFGTPATNESSALYTAVITATAQVGMRLFLHVPPRLAAQFRSDERMLVWSDAFDFRLLYASAMAVIHHAGAGTLHSVSAQGVPSLLVPRGVDQFFWAQRALDQQITATIVPRQRVSVRTLVDALQPLILDPQYRFAARRLALAMADEQALARATKILGAYVT